MIFTQGVQYIQKQYSLPLNQDIPQEKGMIDIFWTKSKDDEAVENLLFST
jgi:hypothetical protein